MQTSLRQATQEKKGQNLWLIRENNWNYPSTHYLPDKQNFLSSLQPTFPGAPPSFYHISTQSVSECPQLLGDL